MLSRLALRAPRAQAPLARGIAPVAAPLAVRFSSSTPRPPPEEKAKSILEALPGHSAVSKTGFVTLTAALSSYLIAEEIYVFNAESVLLASSILFFVGAAKLIRAPFAEGAKSTAESFRSILQGTRDEHADAVKSRIESISQYSDTEALTKDLFALAKETVDLEQKAFVRKQKNAVAAEAKAVLESWVRHEQKAREAEQSQLVATLVENVNKQIATPKFQRDALEEALKGVESAVKAKSF